MYKPSTKQAGFTIVELLIVIVVIGILAAITIVAYNGIQGRARDAKRHTDLAAIQQGLELYYIDNGGYPDCSGGTHLSGGAAPYDTVAVCLASLTPKYLPANLKDPLNSGSSQYWYAVGYKQITASTISLDYSDNYILGAKMESSSATANGYWNQPDLNYLTGSNR